MIYNVTLKPQSFYEMVEAGSDFDGVVKGRFEFDEDAIVYNIRLRMGAEEGKSWSIGIGASVPINLIGGTNEAHVVLNEQIVIPKGEFIQIVTNYAGSTMHAFVVAKQFRS